MFTEMGAGELVEAVAAVVISADDHRLLGAVALASRRPRVDDRPLGVDAGLITREQPQLTAGGLELEVRIGVAAVDVGEQAPFVGVTLAHDLSELARADAAGERTEPAAGLDGGQLAGVADGDHLDIGLDGSLDHFGR